MVSLRYFVCCLFGIIVLYFYIYAPPFQILPFGSDKPFLLFSFLYISYYNQWRILFDIFRKEWIFLATIFFCSLFIYLLHREDNSLCLYDFLLALECLPCSYTIYHLWNKLKVETLKLDKLIIICAIVGSIISSFLLLNPEYTYYIKTTLLKYPEHLLDRFLYRGYGISDGLLFSYPVIQGFCFAFVLVNVGGNNILYKSSLILLFASIMANARSGFVPIAITVLLLLRYRGLLLLKYALIFILLLLIFAGSINLLIENNEMLKAASEWAKSSIYILNDLMAGEKTENIDVLLGDMVVYPTTIDEWLVGSGNNLFGNEFSPTDVGYFIRLNYGGICYLSLWIFLCLYMFRRLYRINRGISLILFLSLVYLNYKGDFFVVNPGSRFFFLVYALIIMDQSLFQNSLTQKFLLK